MPKICDLALSHLGCRGFFDQGFYVLGEMLQLLWRGSMRKGN